MSGLRDVRGKFKKGNGGFWRGRKRPEVKKWLNSPEAVAKRRKALTGRKLSPEHIEKMRRGLTGRKAWPNGRRMTWMEGKNNSNWKGGVSKIERRCRRMPEYLKWRTAVFTRDLWTCQTCRVRGVYLTAHHIKGFARIMKENNIKNLLDSRKCDELWDVNNGVTLCEECHKLTDNYKGRGRIKKSMKKGI